MPRIGPLTLIRRPVVSGRGRGRPGRVPGSASVVSMNVPGEHESGWTTIGSGWSCISPAYRMSKALTVRNRGPNRWAGSNCSGDIPISPSYPCLSRGRPIRGTSHRVRVSLTRGPTRLERAYRSSVRGQTNAVGVHWNPLVLRRLQSLTTVTSAVRILQPLQEFTNLS